MGWGTLLENPSSAVVIKTFCTFLLNKEAERSNAMSVNHCLLVIPSQRRMCPAAACYSIFSVQQSQVGCLEEE